MGSTADLEQPNHVVMEERDNRTFAVVVRAVSRRTVLDATPVLPDGGVPVAHVNPRRVAVLKEERAGGGAEPGEKLSAALPCKGHQTSGGVNRAEFSNLATIRKV